MELEKILEIIENEINYLNKRKTELLKCETDKDIANKIDHEWFLQTRVLYKIKHEIIKETKNGK